MSDSRTNSVGNASDLPPHEVIRAAEAYALDRIAAADRINRRLVKQIAVNFLLGLPGGLPLLFWAKEVRLPQQAVVFTAAAWLATSVVLIRFRSFEELWRYRGNRTARATFVTLLSKATALRIANPLAVSPEQADSLWNEVCLTAIEVSGSDPLD